MVGVYVINAIEINKAYVGSSVDIHKRIRQHKAHLDNNRHYNKALQDYFNKYGRDGIKCSLLYECPKEKLTESEQFFITLYDGISFNVMKVASRHIGWKPSIETRRKISKANTNPSQEVRRKISEALKNPSEETLRRMSAAQSNRSKETLAKLSESKKDKTIYRFYHHIHGERYCTQLQLKTDFDLSTHLSSVITGKRKSTGGWKRI